MTRTRRLLVCVFAGGALLVGGCTDRATAESSATDGHGAAQTSEETGAEASSSTEGTTATNGAYACAPELVGPPVNEAQMPSSMAATLCIAQESCCPGRPSSASCRHWRNMSYERVQADAQGMGLSYDGQCAGLQQAVVEALGCDLDDGSGLPGSGFCSVYFGTQIHDEPCTTLGPLGSDCAQGLSCQRGRCIDMCAREIGERQSVYGYACEAGFVPALDDCFPPDPVGAACQTACVDGAYCGSPRGGCDFECESICRPTVANGQPCSGSEACRIGVCFDGICSDGPGLGEPCDGACDGTAQCDPATDICVVAPAVCRDLPPFP